MHELNIFALSISFYCKLAVYDFEPNNHKLTFYGNSINDIKVQYVWIKYQYCIYTSWITDTIHVASLYNARYFDSIYLLTISQWKFVSMYIIYPVESFYFVLFSFDNYRFLLFIPNRKCSFVCNFKLYEIIYTTILRSMKMTKNRIAIQQILLPYFIYMYVIYIFLILPLIQCFYIGIVHAGMNNAHIFDSWLIIFKYFEKL